MKVLIFSSLTLAGLLLVTLQHRQIGQLSAENAILQQSTAEANQLKADLAKYAGAQAQDAAEEIERLRQENRDLLRLRNEVNQLNDAHAQFEKVSAENLRLQTLVRNMPNPHQNTIQPILIRIDSLYDRGLSTPEAAVQTFFWAEHNGSMDELSRCVLPERWRGMRDIDLGSVWQRQNFQGVVSIEIVARRELDANTVQLGVEFHSERNAAWDKKVVFTLRLRDGDWKLDITNPYL